METTTNRPTFPRRAVVTAGMPYGSKELHFGHVGGVFVHADAFARFLKDRIGAENVIFVSGTDCYGSPIVEKYRSVVADGQFSGTIEQFVESNHLKQKATLERFQIGLSMFCASGLPPAKDIHARVSAEIFEGLYKAGALKKLSNLQFYDTERGTFLNGRQVTGRCPIAGCKSEEAYADECGLGHQYDPRDLIAPISALSGTRPELRPAVNWYYGLEGKQGVLEGYIREREERGEIRPFAAKESREFLKKPIVYVKKEDAAKLNALAGELGEYAFEEDGGNASNLKLTFNKLADREKACLALFAGGIRYRTGKTLVPFRLTGNIEWGVPAPEKDGVKGLTFWVWPESLWAPISFTATYLESIGRDGGEYEKFWRDPESRVYQFIGEDNIYFYGLAEIAFFKDLSGAPAAANGYSGLTSPVIVANKHILYFDKKAASSGKIKPPMADELLRYYTAEQLRAHFLGLGLGVANVPFRPKAFNPAAYNNGNAPQTNAANNGNAPPAAAYNEGDPVLKESTMLTNVYNRAVRTLFYTLQKYNGGVAPRVPVSAGVMREAEGVIVRYERLMAAFEFHSVMSLMDDYTRSINKTLSANMKALQENGDVPSILQVLADAAHMIKTAMVLFHPIVPSGADTVRQYLRIDERVWSWEYIFHPVDFFYSESEHKFKFLEPRVDFFKKHESQLEADKPYPALIHRDK
jgi:methionyl-tRNA synthetase